MTDTKSEGISRATFAWTILLVACVASGLTFFATAWQRPQCDDHRRERHVGGQLQMPHDQREYLDRIHVNGVTALKAYGAGKCFILTGDTQAAHSTQRVLTVIGRAMDEEQLAELYGDEIATFCDGREGYVVRLQEAHHERERRQLGGQREEGGRAVNGCQNSNIVDCGNGQNSVFKCNTGPGEIYHGELTCKSETEFEFRLNKRCDKFKNTQKLRFIKCLQYFIHPDNAKRGEQIAED